MDQIKIIHLNIRSIRSGKDLLEHYMNSENVDIAMISEHWLKPNDNIKFNNFKITTFCRDNGHGGVALQDEKLSSDRNNRNRNNQSLKKFKINKTSAIDIAIAHINIAIEWEKIFENLNSDF